MNRLENKFLIVPGMELGKRKKIYDGRLRQALQRLTSSTNSIPSFQLTAKLEKQTLFKVWKVLKETRGRPAIPTQGYKPGGRYDRLFNAHPL